MIFFPKEKLAQACIVCGKKDANKYGILLVAIDGTESGNNIEARPLHVSCLRLRCNLESGIIYQKCECRDE